MVPNDENTHVHFSSFAINTNIERVVSDLIALPKSRLS